MPASFSVDSHRQFAELSGDFNPIHMDAVAARRTQAGAPVVHGVHALLRLLDGLVAAEPALPAVSALKASFRRMIYVGDSAQLSVRQRTETSLRAGLLVDGVEVVGTTLRFVPGKAPAAPDAGDEPAIASPPQPLDRALDQMQGMRGRLQFAQPAECTARMFPNAARYLGANRVAALACSSTLVGMVVPGLYSLYGELDVTLETGGGSAELDYQVLSVDPRFRMLRIAVRGGGLVGLVSAICRPSPVAQPDMSAMSRRVAPAEFSGSDALIVGGSRGIGEATAKLIAAGGGQVMLTYRSGRADADAVVRQIVDWGGECQAAPYDAQQPALAQVEQLPRAPTHVYYFATPTIARRRVGLFDASRFEEFNRYYVSGFLELVEACLRRRPDGVRFFYPSTVYVADRPPDMTEYAMSKAAGEVLCADLVRQLRQVRIVVHRLPRIATDQTASLIPIAAVEAHEVMLPIVREMHTTS